MIIQVKKIAVLGHFGFGENLLNGQTIKTKIVSDELEKRFGTEEIMKFDTHGGITALLKLPYMLLSALGSCKNIIIFPAHNGLRIIAPLLTFYNCFFGRRLHYAVIGGWLPEFVSKRKFLKKCLKKFYCIYVETSIMKKMLDDQGFKNITVMPNCKNLKIIKDDELPHNFNKPYKLCTFSRVMKEKGIEDAVEAVIAVNEKYKEEVFLLDIYGQVDENQRVWFEELKKNFPCYINYKGCVDFDKSTEVLKEYYALLFPTYYDGEGFAGTLIDAFAAGVPVIASDWKYNNELVHSEITGLIYQTKNVADLCRKLMWICENYDLWVNMKPSCVHSSQKYLPEYAIKSLADNLA